MPTTNSSTLLLLALILISAGAATAQDIGDKPIEWKSTAGTSVTAKLVAEDSKKSTVTLEKSSGKQIVVPLDKLTDESKADAKLLIQQLRTQQNTVGTWYWRCPANNQQEWRIESKLVKNKGVYELVETSQGHTQVPNSTHSYFYRKKGDIYLPIDDKNNGENRSPFEISESGNRLNYERQLIVNDRVLIKGGDFFEINYANKTEAEKWAKKNEKFPAIKIPAQSAGK